jgi:hypothetical protein
MFMMTGSRSLHAAGEVSAISADVVQFGGGLIYLYSAHLENLVTRDRASPIRTWPSRAEHHERKIQNSSTCNLGPVLLDWERYTRQQLVELGIWARPAQTAVNELVKKIGCGFSVCEKNAGASLETELVAGTPHSAREEVKEGGVLGPREVLQMRK